MRGASGYSMYASGSRLSTEAQPETDNYLDLDLEDETDLLMSLLPNYKEPRLVAASIKSTWERLVNGKS
jgi:hypothetical protein